MTLFELDGLTQAAAVVGAVMHPTPQYCWPQLSQRAGCEVWVKHENHTPIGAFKVRGGLVYLDELQRGPGLPSGMITATRGNHGQSIPFAAARHGVPVTVLVPEGNSAEKNLAMIGWGAGTLQGKAELNQQRALQRVEVVVRQDVDEGLAGRGLAHREAFEVVDAEHVSGANPGRDPDAP